MSPSIREAAAIRIGVMGSSGGSAFAAFHDIVAGVLPGRYAFAAASDRACGFEAVCEERGIPLVRAAGPGNAEISQRTADFFASRGGVDLVLLYFLRLVTPAIYERFPTFNIHPALLPAFPGLQPVKRALEAGVKFFGATLHQVDATVDNGPIVAQVVMPIAPSDSRQRLEKLSFLHKVYCSLLLVDLIERKALRFLDRRAVLEDCPGTDRSNPAIAGGPLLEGFRALQQREGAVAIP